MIVGHGIDVVKKSRIQKFFLGMAKSLLIKY